MHTQPVTSQVDSSPVKVLAVVVLYKMLAAQSPTIVTLLEAAKLVPTGALRLQIMLVDNTPGGQLPGTLPEGALYRAAPHNPGLAEAYNLALASASVDGFPWLLTLDQDTSLPSDFLNVLLDHVKVVGNDEQVAVLAGHVVDRGRPLAPYRLAAGFWPKVLPHSFAGLAPPFTSTLNSASLLRVSTLQSIGGYDERFPLNNSDTNLFHRLGRAGARMYVIGGLTISHELALMDRENRMSPERYRQMLADECAFWDLYMNIPARGERLFKLAGRLVKGLIQRERREFQSLTLSELCHRIFTPRRRRIEAWERRFPTSVSL